VYGADLEAVSGGQLGDQLAALGVRAFSDHELHARESSLRREPEGVIEGEAEKGCGGEDDLGYLDLPPLPLAMSAQPARRPPEEQRGAGETGEHASQTRQGRT